MKRFFLLLSVLLAVGCGARAEVAKDKVLAKIDSILGTMEVKRKEIDISVRALNEGTMGCGRRRSRPRSNAIRSGARSNQLLRDLLPSMKRSRS